MLAVAFSLLATSACCRNRCPNPPAGSPSLAEPAPPPFSQFHLPGFDWSKVARVVVLPVHNESPYTRAGAEVRRALGAELQQLGMFEVVTPPPDHPACLSEAIHVHGRFDAAAMLEVAHCFSADVVVHVSITHYLPYTRPRLGLVVQAVSPAEAKVVASVDGLWDTTSLTQASQVRAYYATPKPRLLAVITNSAVPADDGHADELALESPMLFQRYVCHEVSHNLVAIPSSNLVQIPQSDKLLPMPRQLEAIGVFSRQPDSARP